MKRLQFLIVLLFVTGAVISVTEVKAQYNDISYSEFQRNLSPYGRWFNHPQYGQVWSYNQPGFRPYYSDGRWEYTNYGWEWVSGYDWGWAPFHYGRWEYDKYDGWLWIPGYEWAPAWVSWSSYDGYYGWAPLGYGRSVDISFGSIPYDRWTFVPRQNICERDLNRYYVAPQRNPGFRNAVIINNVYEGRGREGKFYRGPDRDEVQRYTHNTIPERTVDIREKSGSYNGVNKPNYNNAGSSIDNRQNSTTPQSQQPGWQFDKANRHRQDNINNNNRIDNFPSKPQPQQSRQKDNILDRTDQEQQSAEQQRQQQTDQQRQLQKQQEFDKQQNQRQIDQQTRQQQIDQQRKLQQIDQQQRQQIDQQTRQQQMDQLQKHQRDQQQYQQQMDQQRQKEVQQRQQQMDQQRQQEVQQRQQQMDQQRQQQMDQQRQQEIQQRQQQDQQRSKQDNYNKRQQPTFQGPPQRENPKSENNPQRSGDNGPSGGIFGKHRGN